MKTSLPYWAPRVLSILYAIFISLFALDVFTAGYQPTELVIALLIHLIPSFILAGITFIAWKREGLGGALFIVVAIVFTILFKAMVHWMTFAVLVAPLLLIGGLFLLLWEGKAPARPPTVS